MWLVRLAHARQSELDSQTDRRPQTADSSDRRKPADRRNPQTAENPQTFLGLCLGSARGNSNTKIKQKKIMKMLTQTC